MELGWVNFLCVVSFIAGFAVTVEVCLCLAKAQYKQDIERNKKTAEELARRLEDLEKEAKANKAAYIKQLNEFEVILKRFRVV